KVKHGMHDKKAILLLTDGEDTSSSINFEDALLKVRQSGLLLYALGIGPDFSATTSRDPGRSTPPVIGPQGGGRRPGTVIVPNFPIPIPIPIPRRRLLPQGPQQRGGVPQR